MAAPAFLQPLAFVVGSRRNNTAAERSGNPTRCAHREPPLQTCYNSSPRGSSPAVFVNFCRRSGVRPPAVLVMHDGCSFVIQSRSTQRKTAFPY